MVAICLLVIVCAVAKKFGASWTFVAPLVIPSFPSFIPGATLSVKSGCYSMTPLYVSSIESAFALYSRAVAVVIFSIEANVSTASNVSPTHALVVNVFAVSNLLEECVCAVIMVLTVEWTAGLLRLTSTGTAEILETLVLGTAILVAITVFYTVRLLTATMSVAENVFSTSIVSSAASVTLFSNVVGTVSLSATTVFVSGDGALVTFSVLALTSSKILTTSSDVASFFR